MSPPTVVICTRDRAASLEIVLWNWGGLSPAPAGLVVVDDGSTDRTPAVVAEARAALPIPVATARTVGVGLGAARNVGWKLTGGDPILFTDDDCSPAADLIARIEECLAETDLAWLGGRLLPYGPDDAGVAVVTRTERVEIAGPGFVPAGLVPGANLTVRRAALAAIGGFDPEFGAGTPFPAEDVDLVARLAAAGFRGAYDPRPVVYHHHGRRTEEARRQLDRSYDAGRGAYYAKCLGDARLRSHYLRAWARSAAKGSWPRAGRELLGAVRYWTRRRAEPGGQGRRTDGS